MSKYFDTHFSKFCFCIYTARRGGSLSYDTEFMVISVYQKQDGQSGVTQRGQFIFREGESRSNVFSFRTIKSKRKHQQDGSEVVINACQNPVRLMRHLIEHFTLPDDNVLDLCSGSGTTAVSCLLSNRNCVSVDNDDFQNQMMQTRLSEFIDTFENTDLEETDGLFDMGEGEH